MYHQTFSPAAGATGQQVSGPLPDLPALHAPGTIFPIQLEQALERRGTIAIWIRTGEVVLNGEDADKVERQILSSATHFNLSLTSNAICTTIKAAFAEDVWGVSGVMMPGLPAGQWLHLAWSWDAEQGHFEACLNGSPLRLPDTRINPWELPACDSFELHLGDWPVAQVSFSDQVLTAAELGQLTPKLYQGSVDNLIGARDRGTLELDELRGETLYERSLASADEVSDWIMEGYGVTSFQDGWMEITSSKPDADPTTEHGHSVFWCPEDFPSDVLVEWEVQPVSEYGLCIIFIAAKGVQGEDIFDPSLAERDGIFGQYTRGDIHSYHMSYYANTPFNPGRATCNMRKNSGFYLVDNGPPGIPPFSTDSYRVAVLKQGPHVQLSVDGRLIIDFLDNGQQYGPAHDDGKIGFRQMQWMTARYRNLKVSALTT